MLYQREGSRERGYSIPAFAIIEERLVIVTVLQVDGHSIARRDILMSSYITILVVISNDYNDV